MRQESAMAAVYVIWAVSILASGVVAHLKSRRIWLWVLFSLIPVVGFATTVLVILLPTRHAARLQEAEAKAALRA